MKLHANSTDSLMNFSRFLLKHLTDEEKPSRLFVELGVLVLLLHIWALSYFLRPEEPSTAAVPLVMEVSLLTEPAQKKPAPPPPAPVIKRTDVPKKVKPKPVIKKAAPVIPKPRRETLRPKPVPAVRPSQPEQNISAPPSIATKASPAPVAPKAPTPKREEPLIEANYRANYAFNPKPEYPRTARKRGWQGKVLLKVRVSAKGYSESVSIHQSSGHETLDESAMEAVKKWKFIPARRGDTPVASSVIVPIQFKLNN